MRKLYALEQALSVGLFIVILAALCWQIVSRYVLNAASSWTEELSKLLFTQMGVLGCHIAQRERLHVRIDTVLISLPAGAQKALDLCIDALMAVVFAYLGWQGVLISLRKAPVQMVTLNASSALLFSALIVLGVLMAVELAAQGASSLIRSGKGKSR